MSWLSPYAVSIPEDELDDLRARLARTRWIDDLPETAWDLGVSCVYLQELCEYWRTTFDWRAQETLLNSYSQYMVDVDGQSIHFVHARSARTDALPLLLIHGWPGSVFEYIKVLDPLSRPASFGADAADSFHVVTPSIPGYGFSGPTRRPGWGPARIASAFAELMHRLGYERYAVAGGDWGAIIGTELARMDGGVHVCGLHLTMPLGLPPSDGDLDELSPSDQQGLDDWARHQAAGNVVHVAINSTRPHTLAFGLNDSPVGLAAWLIDKYRAYSDCDGDVEASFTRDELLTEVSTYWLTGTIASASRLYYERAEETRNLVSTAPPIRVPTGCAIFPKDVRRVPRSWADRVYTNIERWTEMSAGGHFPGLEEPELLVGELRSFFAPAATQSLSDGGLVGASGTQEPMCRRFVRWADVGPNWAGTRPTRSMYVRQQSHHQGQGLKPADRHQYRFADADREHVRQSRVGIGQPGRPRHRGRSPDQSRPHIGLAGRISVAVPPTVRGAQCRDDWRPVRPRASDPHAQSAGALVVNNLSIAAPRTKMDINGRFIDLDTIAAIERWASQLIAAVGAAPSERRALVSNVVAPYGIDPARFGELPPARVT